MIEKLWNILDRDLENHKDYLELFSMLFMKRVVEMARAPGGELGL